MQNILPILSIFGNKNFNHILPRQSQGTINCAFYRAKNKKVYQVFAHPLTRENKKGEVRNDKVDYELNGDCMKIASSVDLPIHHVNCLLHFFFIRRV